MARYVFVVLTNAVTGREDEFNRWYTDEHLDHCLELDFFISAQRFRFVPKVAGELASHRYLTIYEVETDDVQATYRMLTKVGGTHVMPLSDAMQLSDRVGWFFEPITERRTQPAKAADPVSPGEMSSG